MSSHRAEKQPRPWRRRLLAAGALLVAVGLIGYGTRGLWDRHQATHGGPNTMAAGELDETPVPISECQAAGDDDPRIIRLGSLGVEGCVVKVGVTRGQMDSPGNVHVAGWFDQSPRPGDPAADGEISIIDGHSSGRYKNGVFNKLGDFEEGSIFTVELGDGTVRRFEVTSVKKHRVEDTMTQLAVDAANQQATLALITCGGQYDAKNHAFDRRVVVLATTAT